MVRHGCKNHRRKCPIRNKKVMSHLALWSTTWLGWRQKSTTSPPPLHNTPACYLRSSVHTYSVPSGQHVTIFNWIIPLQGRIPQVLQREQSLSNITISTLNTDWQNSPCTNWSRKWHCLCSTVNNNCWIEFSSQSSEHPFHIPGMSNSQYRLRL